MVTGESCVANGKQKHFIKNYGCRCFSHNMSFLLYGHEGTADKVIFVQANIAGMIGIAPQGGLRCVYKSLRKV